MTLPPEPQSTAVDDEAVVRVFSRITAAYCSALVLVGLLGVFVLVPDPVVTIAGLALGLVAGLVSLIAPPVLIRGALTRAASAGVEPGGEYAVVRTAVFVGLAVAEVPPLVALALVVTGDNHDVGALVLSVPFAVVSLVVNVSGAGAVRRHLARVRGGTPLA